jgi:ABC-type dipeptide/oligopeptide/nickel transport system permease component
MEQYGTFLRDILRGDFGTSFATKEPATDAIGNAMPYSLQLAGMSLLIGIVLAFPIGVISAMRRGTWIDLALRGIAILGIAAPGFFVATVFSLFVLRLNLWTIDVVNQPLLWEDPMDSLKLFIIPATAGGFALAAVLARILRSQMLEVLNQDYVRTAYSKGLDARVVVLRHILKNAMLPVVTILGLSFGALLGGQVVLEQMFNIPGMGRVMFGAIQVRDYPMLQAASFIVAVWLVTVNLLVDLSYFALDPRIKGAL